MLFGGGQNDADVSKAIGGLDQSSKRLTATATQTAGQSNELLNPAIDYLKAVLGGDRQAMLQATMPERRRVIDQYDAAKKAIAEFAPRGGGTAGALANLNASQAGDLAQVGSQARGNAVNQAGILGANLKGASIGAEGAASADISKILDTYLQQGQQQGQSAADIGMGLAGLIGSIFF
jgi:hypothetical protein